MCLLWGVNWGFISKKTAFVIFTAVETSILHYTQQDSLDVVFSTSQGLYRHRRAQQNKCRYISVTRVGFKLTIPTFNWSKPVSTLDHATCIIGPCTSANIIYIYVTEKVNVLRRTITKLRHVQYSKVKLSLQEPWRPIRLRAVADPKRSRQLVDWWPSGCQPYAPAAHYHHGIFLVFVSVRGQVNPMAILGLGGLSKLT
jgi:hypothetical protein